MSQAFDCFMVESRIGTNRKLRRLPVVQRWTFVAGVLALAAQSPLRGALLITDGVPVTAEDVAKEATVPVRDARAALGSLRELGMLELDEHGVEWVHDWDTINPDPRPSDSREATRERKRRQRAKARSTAVSPARERFTSVSRAFHEPFHDQDLSVSRTFHGAAHAPHQTPTERQIPTHVTRDIGVTSRECHAPEEEGEEEGEELTPPTHCQHVGIGSSQNQESKEAR